MAKILWKGGVEPPDVKAKTGEDKSVATYTGMVEEPPEVEADGAPPEAEAGEKSGQMTGEMFGEMIARTKENFDKQIASRRPVEPVHKPMAHEQKNQETAVKSSRAVTSRGEAARRMATIYSIRRKVVVEDREQPIVIAGGNQRVPILMSLRANGATALALEVDEPENEPGVKPKVRPQKAVPVRFPLSNEQLKAEEFYRTTGMKIEDFRELVTPGWTLAEALSPRENARKMRVGLCGLWYDTELMVLKAKHAVHDIFYKKRPCRSET